MQTFLEEAQEQQAEVSLPRQALWFFVHAFIALAAWAALMLAGYLAQPSAVPQWAILLLSILVPGCAGLFLNRLRQDEMATLVWLLGLIWLLVVALWILDMPTGPNACFQCDATDKIFRSLLSVPSPSGLIDDDGPFIGTWPAAALFGYAAGARLALRKHSC